MGCKGKVCIYYCLVGLGDDQENTTTTFVRGTLFFVTIITKAFFTVKGHFPGSSMNKGLSGIGRRKWD